MRKRTKTAHLLPDAGHAAVGAVCLFYFAFPVSFVLYFLFRSEIFFDFGSFFYSRFACGSIRLCNCTNDFTI